MRSLLLATAALAWMTTQASALPSIDAGSTLNVSGNATFTANDVNFSNTGALLSGTGAYASLATCLSCVVVAPQLQYSPFANLTNVLFVSEGGITATVSIDGQIDAPVITGNDLALNDDALLTLTGYAPTVGTLFLSVNQATGVLSGSFSATAQGTSVIEPSSLAVLGLAVAGIIVARRRGPHTVCQT